MNSEFLKIPNGRSIYNVPINNIIHIKSKGAYSEIYLVSGERHRCARNISRLFEILGDKEYFYRPHKSHVINLNRVTQYMSFGRCGMVVMTCGTMIPISKRGKSEFLSVFKNK
jgi:DNA-binding LytR/AlgR family response regulator